MLPKGRQLTPDTLFPFSQATLAHAAGILGTYGIHHGYPQQLGFIPGR